MEKYSVLMSLYKNENYEYLKLAIDSMINQTIKPDEIVIVEDGPLTDELYEVIDYYTKNNPELFKIVKSEKNIGLGLALNKGLLECKNNIVARMDTDDISKVDRCEKQLKEFEKENDLDIVGAYVDEFSDNIKNIISTRKVPIDYKDIYNFAKKRSSFNHPVVMYKKESVLKNGGYSNLRRNQDVDLFGRMLYFGCKAKNIDESLLFFRSNIDLAKRRKSWENTKTYIKVIKNFWKIGYSSFWNYIEVLIAQVLMFITPAKLQVWVYKKFLRK